MCLLTCTQLRMIHDYNRVKMRLATSIYIEEGGQVDDE